MIRTDAPRELYAFFTDVLQLPVAWPLMSPRPGVTTGGVAFGNVNVEAIQVPAQKDKAPRLLGFAFEPSPWTSVWPNWIDAGSRMVSGGRSW